jgi:hypothetical protein
MSESTTSGRLACSALELSLGETTTAATKPEAQHQAGQAALLAELPENRDVVDQSTCLAVIGAHYNVPDDSSASAETKWRM